METYTLVLVLLFQGAPRAVSTIDGYQRDRCEVAAYSSNTAQPPPRKLEVVAYCIPGPQK